MNRPILDIIKTVDNTFKGVIDYETTKHIVMYDLTAVENPHATMVVIAWRLHPESVRFSVFKSSHFPDMDFGRLLQIPKKTIDVINPPIESPPDSSFD